MCDILVERLERSFHRNSLFYVGMLSGSQGHEEIAGALRDKLANKRISTMYCRLDADGYVPHRRFSKTLTEARAKRQQFVLVVWCLEHLPESSLIDTCAWLNSNREWLSLKPSSGQSPVPTVLLMSRTFYRERFSRQANHLMSCAPWPIEL